MRGEDFGEAEELSVAGGEPQGGNRRGPAAGDRPQGTSRRGRAAMGINRETGL